LNPGPPPGPPPGLKRGPFGVFGKNRRMLEKMEREARNFKSRYKKIEVKRRLKIAVFT